MKKIKRGDIEKLKRQGYELDPKAQLMFDNERLLKLLKSNADSISAAISGIRLDQAPVVEVMNSINRSLQAMNTTMQNLKFPAPPAVPEKKPHDWRFTVERDKQGFIETIKAEAV